MNESRWHPFRVTPPGGRPDRIRSIRTPEGRGDRLRSVAFAELQARELFLRAPLQFPDAGEELHRAWRTLALDEDRHLGWLLARMEEAGVDPAERAQSTALWDSLSRLPPAELDTFCARMAGAEERGVEAGHDLHRLLQDHDPESAAIFLRIAQEEVTHVEWGRRVLAGLGGGGSV